MLKITRLNEWLVAWSMLTIMHNDAQLKPLLNKNTEQNYQNYQNHHHHQQHTNTMHKARFKKSSIFLCAFIIILGFLICLYVLQTSPEFNQYNIIKDYQLQRKQKQQTTKTILLWNTFFGDKKWDLPYDTMGPNDLRDELKCPIYDCELTNRKHFLPDVSMFDAVIFHTAVMFSFRNAIPSKRSPHQSYVFALMESPAETKHKLSDEAGFYNLSMTYRLDSDILWPYKYIIDKETEERIAPALKPQWRKPTTDFNDTEIFTAWMGKNKTAAWFVSHCRTMSKREKLVEALQQHISVDIYGACGHLR